MTIERMVLAALAVFFGWLAVLALAMVLGDAAPGALALFPPAGFTANLPEGAAVVSAGRAHVTVRSDAPGLGLALYRAGALLVLPAGLAGCMPLPAGP